MKNLVLLILPFVAFTQSIFCHGISDADKASMMSADYLQYIGLGASHMITGYDHLLFLFGVIFFLSKFKDIVWFISAFTIGHSITLIFATFMGISANYFLIDAVIALTVMYKGFDNIQGFQKYLNIQPPSIIKLVFVFGLIHGFGLSTRLQELPLGDSGLLLKIISFNVGVELGQIAALTLMLFILSGWRQKPSFQKFSVLTNVTIIFLGAMLFLMQMHGYEHHIMDAESKANTPIVYKDSTVINIPAGKSLEYKFLVKKGQTLNYHWESNGIALYYDFHGDVSGSKNGEFKSFEKQTAKSATGSQIAPFDGKFGWYWKNNSSQAVSVTLKSGGDYVVLGM
ncbi:MAG: HupE/UreJ family protein [Candidatus Cloacimonetes bacterium]|nr:HupE/UreJ family protein [Candidatus Cloacimonadota bacterium]